MVTLFTLFLAEDVVLSYEAVVQQDCKYS